jgi:hypothetical protein
MTRNERNTEASEWLATQQTKAQPVLVPHISVTPERILNWMIAAVLIVSVIALVNGAVYWVQHLGARL